MNDDNIVEGIAKKLLRRDADLVSKIDPRTRLSKEVKSKLGRQIRAKREAHGWTQSDPGEWCGIKKSRLSKIENGDLGDAVLRLLLMAELFECELQFVERPREAVS